MPSNKGTSLRPEEREAVKRMALRGLSIREIADALDIPYQRARNHTTYLLNNGTIPSAVQRKAMARQDDNRSFLRNERVIRQIRYGTMIEVLQGMHADHIHWLLDQVPKGGTVADVMRGIIVDAYTEEVGE